MIAKNFLQKRQNFRTTDVFAAVASSLLKLPNHFFCSVEIAQQQFVEAKDDKP